jgi:bacterioferritin
MNRERSIELLNKSVADELQAVNQYIYFHVHLADQGLVPLAAIFKRTAIVEMGHVEKLAERILFLKGEVEMKPAGDVEKITDAADMLAYGAKAEEDAAKFYNEAAKESAANSDAVSKQIFEQLVGDEEGHYEVFDRQLENIKRFGQAYLALQSFEATAGLRPSSIVIMWACPRLRTLLRRK